MIHKRRKELGMTQEECAGLMNVDTATYVKLEKGASNVMVKNLILAVDCLELGENSFNDVIKRFR